MKRMFVFLFVLLCLCFVFSYKKPSGVALENLKGEYSLYLNTQYNSIPSFAKATNNGDGQIVQCDLSLINELKFDSKKIGGESVKVSMKDYTYDQICDILNFRKKNIMNSLMDSKLFMGRQAMVKNLFMLEQKE